MTRATAARTTGALEVDLHVPQAAGLVEAAHGVCPYSRATRGNIDMKLTLDGRPVG